MCTPCRWALSRYHQHSHLLAERGTGNSPNSGRPPVEQFPRPIPAPGGRPDTTASAGLRVPDPQLPPTKTPAGRRSSCPAPLPAPGGQPDPRHQTRDFSVGQLRWARCPDDGRLHLLQPTDVVVAATWDHAEACPPLISGDAAARALQEYFLANADRGDNAANDELVAELVRRIRALRSSRAHGC